MIAVTKNLAQQCRLCYGNLLFYYNLVIVVRGFLMRGIRTVLHTQQL
jgi:hypothetical protein